MNVTQVALNRMIRRQFDYNNLVLILTNGAAATTATATYSQVSASEVTGTGYAQKDLSVTPTGSILFFDSDLTYTDADFSDADQAIIVESATGAGSLSPTDPVVAFASVTVEPNGTTATIADNASGLFGLTLPA